MDDRLAALYITVVETSRSKHVAVSDNEIEAMSEVAGADLNCIQNAINKALAGYKDQVRRLEAGIEDSPIEA